MLAQGTAGPSLTSDGATSNTGLRIGRLGDTIVSELHGRFYEQVFRGNVYSIGCGATALSANTISLSNTTTPILGVGNPSTSSVNLVMLQCSLAVHANTLTTPTPPGPFLWASSLGNTAALTAGVAPFNRKTLASSGSQAKAFNSVALTGLVNNLVVFDGAALPDMGIFVAGTITAQTTTSNATVGAFGTQNFDGSLIVPPGGVLALLNTTSTTTYSVSGFLMWEEVSIT